MDINEFNRALEMIDRLLEENKLDKAQELFILMEKEWAQQGTEEVMEKLDLWRGKIDGAWRKRAKRSLEEVRADGNSNNSIWNEYHFLITTIGEQNDFNHEKLRRGIMPLVHLMCHSVELGLKFNIEILRKYFPEFEPETKLKGALRIEKTHDLNELTMIFKAYFRFAFDRLPAIEKFDSDTITEYYNLIKYLDDFLNHVKPNTSAYRYESLISRNGKRIPAIEKGHSIHIFDLYTEYRTLYEALRYSIDCFEPYFQFKELKDTMKGYNRGVGILYETKSQIHVDLETGEKSSDATRIIESHRSDGSNIYDQSETQKYIDILVPGVLFFDKIRNQYFELLEVGNYHYLNVISRIEADEVFLKHNLN